MLSQMSSWLCFWLSEASQPAFAALMLVLSKTHIGYGLLRLVSVAGGMDCGRHLPLGELYAVWVEATPPV